MRSLAIVLLLVGCGDGQFLEAPAERRTESLTVNNYALADATVRDGSYAGFPQGALRTLEVKTYEVGWNRFSYLRFDINDMPDTGGSATLHMYGTFLGTGEPVEARARAVGDTTWTERTLTWNNAPARDRAAIATALVSGEPRWYTWDLTTHVHALKASGATQVDLALTNGEYSNALASFSSRESPSNPPFLVLSSENNNTAPTVAVPASAWPSVVERGYTVLRAVGADDTGEINLTYTWQTIGTPPAPVRYNDANGSNQGGTYTLAYFSAPGSYDFRVTIADSQGLSVTSDVSVTVQLNPKYWSVTLEPEAATLHPGETLQLHATVLDQFGAPLVPQPAVFWRSSGGFVTESGLYTAGNQPGDDFYVYARSTGLFGDTTQITIVP
jgi:hypothetical protein